jgi:hypothetical protein
MKALRKRAAKADADDILVMIAHRSVVGGRIGGGLTQPKWAPRQGSQIMHKNKAFEMLPSIQQLPKIPVHGAVIYYRIAKRIKLVLVGRIPGWL